MNVIAVQSTNVNTEILNVEGMWDRGAIALCIYQSRVVHLML